MYQLEARIRYSDIARLECSWYTTTRKSPLNVTWFSYAAFRSRRKTWLMKSSTPWHWKIRRFLSLRRPIDHALCWSRCYRLLRSANWSRWRISTHSYYAHTWTVSTSLKIWTKKKPSSQATRKPPKQQPNCGSKMPLQTRLTRRSYLTTCAGIWLAVLLTCRLCSRSIMCYSSVTSR